MLICRCTNGHTFEACLIEDDPDTNCTVTDPDLCPECETEDFQIIDEDFEDYL